MLDQVPALFICLYQGFICKSFCTNFDGLRGKYLIPNNECKCLHEPLPIYCSISESGSCHPTFAISGLATPLHG